MLGDFAIVLGGAVAILAIAALVIRLTVRHYGLSGGFVGLSILSVGTNLPEIMIHVVGNVHILRDPAAATLSAMLLGNNVGPDMNDT